MNLDQSRQAYTSMMKVTIDGRPYLKDIHDLFGALITQIQLRTHRYLFRNYYNTFSTEDAMAALASLRVSHTVRTPDTKNRQNHQAQTVTTITTFHMDKDMAKALCLQFQSCRLMENAVEPTHSRHSSATINDKTLWQLTPKGLCVLQDFCLRTEVDMTCMRPHFETIPSIQLVPLDRHPDDDQLRLGRQYLSLLFMIMITSLPLEGNVLLHYQQILPDLVSSSAKKTSPTSSSASSVSSSSSSSSSSTPAAAVVAAPFTMSTNSHTVDDSKVQLLGNYLLTLSRKPNQQQLPHQKMYIQQLQKDYQHKKQLGITSNSIRSVFSSQLGYDWLIDCSTVSCYDEAQAILETFIKYGWLKYHEDSLKYADEPLEASSKVLLEVTPNGHQIIVTKISSATNTNNSSSSSSTDQQAKPTSPQQDISVDLGDLLSNESSTSATPTSPTTPTTTTTTNNNDRRNSLCLSSREAVAATRSSNNNNGGGDGPSNNATKLQHILDDATLRSLFKVFLRANFCEENLDFWIDYAALGRKLKQRGVMASHHQKKELLEDAYDVWSTYLKPQAPSELNIDHALRQDMARGVNAIISLEANNSVVIVSSHSVSTSLRMMIKWLDQVNDHIFRLMASDSVPKFIKTPTYRQHCNSNSSNSNSRNEISPSIPIL